MQSNRPKTDDFCHSRTISILIIDWAKMCALIELKQSSHVSISTKLREKRLGANLLGCAHYWIFQMKEREL